ncbi:dihydrofolate reductase family protein [Pararhodobacter zhoushanensis]|uniref:dihydrofolate reductase family protein n=1 Tax=Pararhodobacter zhoushanensis TaxID=2479545 RepID=UPI000F8D839F|nr:dihydrofolate reductase family protein [Pararhodobacter zhoushanensis]
MATLVFGMNVSLDGFVDYTEFAPSPPLFRHFIEQAKGQAGSLYGRTLYELMAYWDAEQPGWGDAEQEFAVAWRRQPKWVVSRSLTSVGPNATLLGDDVEAEVRALKARVEGEIEVAGPTLAASLGALGLIDLYRLYLHPVVLGQGTPFFSGPLPRLRLVSTETIAEEYVCLSYVPA